MIVVKKHFLSSGKQFCLAVAFIVATSLLLPPTALAATSQLSTSADRDLVTRLAAPDRNTRTAAALELRLYGQSALPLLLKACKDLDPIQRRGGVIGLTLLPTQILGMDMLLSALDDMDMGTRSMAAHGLALIGKPAAPRLAAKLADPNPMGRDAAAFGLQLMGPKAIPALTELLETGDDYTKSKAAWLLGRMGKSALPSVPALIKSLAVKDERAMHVVAEAIDLIGPDPATTAFHLVQINETTGCPVKRIGAQAAPTLVRLLTRPGTPLAQIAFRTLASIGDGAKPALRHGLESGTQGQRIATALLLVEIDQNEVFALPEDVRNALANVPRRGKK